MSSNIIKKERRVNSREALDDFENARRNLCHCSSKIITQDFSLGRGW